MKKLRKALAVILAAATALVSSVTTASAETLDVRSPFYPMEFSSGNGWGRNAVKLMDGSSVEAEDYLPVYAVKKNGVYQAAYCIEPGVAFGDNSQRESHGSDYWKNYSRPQNKTLSTREIQKLLGELMTQAYQGSFSINETVGYVTEGQEANLAKWRAAQILVWEVIVGERDINFKHVNPPSGKNKVTDQLRSNFPQATAFWNEYNRIVSEIQSLYKIPSFLSKTEGKAPAITLKWDGTQYKATLTDKNGVLSKFDFTVSPTSVTLTKSGNDLIITSKKPVENVSIYAEHQTTSCTGIVVWTNSDGYQALANTAGIADPLEGHAKAGTPSGTLEIVKKASDGLPIQGWSFDIVPQDGATFADGSKKMTVTTNKDGKASATVPAGPTYKVTETGHQSIPDTAYTVSYDKQTITVAADSTSKLTATNEENIGYVKVKKKVAEVSGATTDKIDYTKFSFTLKGTSDSGRSISLTAKCDKDGIASF